MAAATAAVNSPERQGKLLEALPVEAATTVFVGTIAARNAAGNIVPAADVAGLAVLGRCEGISETVNAGGVDALVGSDGVNPGAAGAVQVNVKRGTFRWNNSGGDPLTLADIGHTAYVEDDNTVNKTGGAHQIAAGKVAGVDADGVWVQVV